MQVMQEIIRRKRDGSDLTSEEISFIVDGFVAGTIPDYQVSALFMAAFFRGLNTFETSVFLSKMINSGTRLDWSIYGSSRRFVDKHSTGGVGDKSSLVILPLLIADGFDVPMICGRGLAHTGGTVDKLESLPGFETQPSLEKFKHWIESCHGAFVGQSDDFVPADKKMYALRDVTGTVENIGLITASIMSKKIAEGISGLVLDVKFGSGAFMQKVEDSERLARSLIAAGEAVGCKTIAALTNMDEPLGRTGGNAIEVAECLDVLSGAGPFDTRELSLQLAAGAAVAHSGKKTEEEINKAYSRMRNHLDSGRAFEIFVKVAAAQGAHVQDLERKNTKWIDGNAVQTPVLAKKSGFISSVDTREMGMAIVEMGGGRQSKEDKINPYVGYSALKKVGERIEKGEPLCILHTDAGKADAIVKRVEKAMKISDSEVQPLPLIHSWIF